MKKFFLLSFSLITVASFILVSCKNDDDSMTMEQTDGIPSFVQAVDLGLSVKWASCNLGADSVEGEGDYYAWGETKTKSRYTWENYRLRDGGSIDNDDITYNKYNTIDKRGEVDNKTILEECDDVAHLKWGGSWHIPTQLEICELLDTNNCKWSWITQKGVEGFKVTSKKPGYTDKSIFLPATGLFNAYYHPYYDYDGFNCCGYMSSSLNEEDPDCVWYLRFRYKNRDLRDFKDRSIGQTIRPVCSSDSWIGITSIILDKDSLKLIADTIANDYGESTINFSMMSGDVEYDYYKKYVTWTSSDESVATVDSNGKVIAKSEGKTKVTASYNGISSSCTVLVKGVNYSISGYENGYSYVDLGLSVKWATMNVGASDKEDYGNYYAWGEIEPQREYRWSSYRFWISGDWGDDIKFSKYVVGEGGDNITTLDPEDDVAHVQMKGNWRMPSTDEMNELINNCNWKWVSINGVNGVRFSSAKSGFEGNSIFLPAAGHRYYFTTLFVGSSGCYWTNSIASKSSAKELSIGQNSCGVVTTSRCYGFPVRAVYP